MIARAVRLRNRLGAVALALLAMPALAQDTLPVAVVPQPASVERLDGAFVLDATTTVAVTTDDPEVRRIAETWAARVRLASALALPLAEVDVEPENQVVFHLDPEAAIEDEGYALTVTREGVLVKAASEAGLFYGAQTLRQLLPPAVERGGALPAETEVAWAIPAVRIEDAPRFGWRGLHLDVGRHFQPVAFVKRYLDLMALHKLNRFHWHLTEDQGWRIEIERYPRLTEVGAWRDGTLVGSYRNEPHTYDGVRYGGYYTQDEIREVVAYAAERHITVVPEIEMPGHASAAIAAYPELGCSGEPVEVVQGWGVFEDIFCPTEATFTFLENVLTEVLDLFPGEHVHIGGDEAPKGAWERSAAAQEVIRREGLADEHELQSYVVRRIERFLSERGRRLVGWDEIVEGGLSPTATLMYWRSWDEAPLRQAAAQGNDIVMTPNHTLYLDHYQADPASEPLAIGGLTTLQDVYAYEPVPAFFSEGQAASILGAQGNVWTEYLPEPHDVEYMVWPRALALAEAVWSEPARRDWVDFQDRLPTALDRLRILGVNYRPPDLP
ncbi:MAG: beta-N-acetylhexosaminidase [Bacteroidota bacterium]